MKKLLGKPLKAKEKRDIIAKISEALDDEHRPVRDRQFKDFMNEPYKEDAGLAADQSKYVGTQVSDQVEAITAQAMSVLMSDDRLVDFMPLKKGDEAAAKQETHIIHHIIRNKHNSYAFISDWFKGGLIHGIGYLLARQEKRKRRSMVRLDDLTEDEFFFKYNEIVAQQEAGEHEFEIQRLDGAKMKKRRGEDAYDITPLMDEDGNPQKITARIVLMKESREYIIEPVPHDEIFITPRWHEVSLQKCPLVARRTQRTRAELIAMGFSKESVKTLQTGDQEKNESDRQRHNTRNSDDVLDSKRLREMVYITESYVRITDADHNGDPLMQVWTGGEGVQILKWENGDEAIEEVDRVPLVAWTPSVVPHRHYGRGIAEMAQQNQRLASVLWRQTVDNANLQNNLRPVVANRLANDETIDNIEQGGMGSVVSAEEQGAVDWIKPPDITQYMLPLMGQNTQDLSKTTGYNDQVHGTGFKDIERTKVGSQGLGQMMARADSRVQIYIRNFIEFGLRELALAIHADLQGGDSKQMAIEINGEWVEYDPSSWQKRTDMIVRVGSGKSDRQETIEQLMWLLTQQKEAIGLGAHWVKPQHIYNTISKIMETWGMRGINDFATSPDKAGDPPKKEPSIQDQAAIKAAEALILEAKAKMKDADTKVKLAQIKERSDFQRHSLDVKALASKEREAFYRLQIVAAEAQMKGFDIAIKAGKTEAETEAIVDKIGNGGQNNDTK